MNADPLRLARAAEALRRNRIDAALLTTPPAVTYASGWEVPLPGTYLTEVVGWLPPVAVLGADGAGVLLVSEDDAADAHADSVLDVRTFESLGHFAPSDPAGTWAAAVGDAVRELGGRRLGVEASLPRAALGALPPLELADATAAIDEARAVKTQQEVERLRAAIAVADAAQRRLVELAPDAPGMTEVALWSELSTAMFTVAGAAVPVTGVLLTGARTAVLTSRGPVDRVVAAGEVGLLDVGARLGGYWSDSANAVVFGGGPGADQRRYLDAARAACEAAIDRLRPGLPCSEPARALAEGLGRFGFRMAHYAGHQLGVAVNEGPRLVPYGKEPILEGMVFAVEAGAYAGEDGCVGVRREKVALVTADGPELLSEFDWE